MNIEHFIHPTDEKPLENLISTGGLTAIFRRIGCVGDSLSSGEPEMTDPTDKKVCPDLCEHSWGQYNAITDLCCVTYPNRTTAFGLHSHKTDCPDPLRQSVFVLSCVFNIKITPDTASDNLR